MNKNHLIVFLLCIILVACNKKEKIPPIADFTADKTVGTAPLEVSFLDQSHYNPNIWRWNFGDGNTSNEQNPQHTYTSEGYFNVTLTVENQDGENTVVKSRFTYIDSTLGQKCPGVPDFKYHGKWYSTVLIGSQCWMKQNLNYEIGESYCYNKNDENCSTYGRLYNWETIMNGEASSNSVPSGVQGICPDGWHIPSDEEWKILEGFVDPQLGPGHDEWDKTGRRGIFAGLHLKTSILWAEYPGNDAFGFSGQPAGACCGDPDIIGPPGASAWSSIKYSTTFWSSTTLYSGSVYCRGLGWTDDLISRGAWNNYYCFFSLRCLKD